MSARPTQYKPLDWWNYNIPSGSRTSQCPDFLSSCSDKDRRIIGTLEKDYPPFSWPAVQNIIKFNCLHLFRRQPTQLRRYLHFKHTTKRTHGSVKNYILKERLHWSDLNAKAGPFVDADDFRILHNDWPYGIDPQIVHLVVWTKFSLPEDAATGELTAEGRALVDEFVGKTFLREMPRERVTWFKNWKSIKSIEAVEHFHVMLLQPDPAFVQELTKGDEPMVKKWDVSNRGELRPDVS